jgi:hypothetical protein
MESYVGQISEVESLAPTWARTKKGLIRGQLLWGGAKPKGQPAAASQAGPQSQQPGTSEKKPGEEKTGPKPRRPARPDQGDLFPLEQIGDRVSLGGKDYPVIVRRVVPPSAFNEKALADAAYYDDEADVWKVVTDEQARSRLANQVRAGTLQLWPLDKDSETQE